MRATALGRVASVLGGAVVCAAAFATPFTWDPVNSHVWAGAQGQGQGELGGPYTSFQSQVIGGIANGGQSNGLHTFNASGVRFDVGILMVHWYTPSAASFAFAYGRLIFTPTVPNLSYSFEGSMITLEGDAASNTATSTVELYPDFPRPPMMYRNAVIGGTGFALWSPSTPQVGSQTGDLVPGQQYVMNWLFWLTMVGQTDETALFEVKTKSGPFFHFRLYQRPCAGDLSGDGYVDDADFVAFAAAYSIFDCEDPMMPPGCPSDLNGDGYVDDADFVTFAMAYENLVCP